MHIPRGTDRRGHPEIKRFLYFRHAAKLFFFKWWAGGYHSKLPELVEDFPQLFSEILGSVRGFVHEMKIKAFLSPAQQKLIRLSLSVREEVSEELTKLKRSKVVERIDASECVSPIVVARKKTSCFA